MKETPVKLENGFSLEFCPDEVRGHTGHTTLCHGDTPDNASCTQS